MLIMLEPGDATRYEFLAEPGNKGYLYIAGSPRFDLYEYEVDEVKRFYAKYPEIETSKDAALWAVVNDSFISYIIAHSNCNPWTALAAIIAMKRWIDRNEK